jgi:diadenosine tetraphosphatase ApaH/serine/threonine PP2A family protein phosphatase
VYNNHLALEAVLADADTSGADTLLCLGDVGGFGPHPDRAADRLRQSRVVVLQGNYDDSVGNGLEDCQCGYTDPRDNHFARVSYDYTLEHTSDENRAWMRTLPRQMRLELGGLRVLCAHGSPRRVNEFLWESMTPEPFLRRMLDEQDADLVLVTHTGLHWQRWLGNEPRRGLVNVGAIGRPANDGDTAVWYALIDAPASVQTPPRVEFRRVEYDHVALAAEMRAERLPEEFIETILTGWWTSCLEILPQKERARGRF